MMSTAVYARIDPDNPAAFSPAVVQGMLRGDLGFHGVIVSDDLGNARQVASVPVPDRALRFLAAGGDLVLTLDNSETAAMVGAVSLERTLTRAFARRSTPRRFGCCSQATPRAASLNGSAAQLPEPG